MENQHRKIKGYRDLCQEEIDLMNEIKEFGPKLAVLAGKITAVNAALEIREGLDFSKSEPNRWVSVGITDLQKGLMGLTRAVAKPEFF